MTRRAGVARRYARALLDVAREKGDPARVREGLSAVKATLDASAELRRVLTHPALPVDKQAKVADALWAGLDELTRRLLRLLLERRRLALVPEIERAYGEMWNESRGVVSAEAVSASALTPEQAAALEAALARVTGRAVEMRSEVQAALVGGLLVRLQGRTYDGSVRTRLRLLKQRLAGGTPPA